MESTLSIESDYQIRNQEIRILLPDTYSPDKRYRALYVLPVEKGFEQRFGYGLGVLRDMNAQNLYDIIIVQMGFDRDPWYVDHVSDPQIRQASYLKEVVVPFVENRYSTLGTHEGRLLFGFSKSGWGAFSLILRSPEFFGYAAAWDSPMLLRDSWQDWFMPYGTLEHMDLYRPDRLVPKQKTFFQKRARLVLTGENCWGMTAPTPDGVSHTVGMHRLLEKEGVVHRYDNSLHAPHRWDRAWVGPTVKQLMSITMKEGNHET